MGIQELIVLAIAGAALFYVVRYVRRSFAGTGCGCAGGKPCAGASGAQSDRAPRRIPLISLNVSSAESAPNSK